MSSSKSIDRRTIMTGAAWAVPAVVIAAPAPAFAASPPCVPANWYAQSDYYPNTPDAPNSNFNEFETMTSTPPGWFKMQHWNLGSDYYWRVNLVVQNGAEPGAVITVPIHPSWSVLPGYTVAYDGQRIFGNAPAGLSYTTDAAGRTYAIAALPTATITQTATEITIAFADAIPAGGGGTFVIRAVPDPALPTVTWTSPDGATTIDTIMISAEMTMHFTPSTC